MLLLTSVFVSERKMRTTESFLLLHTHFSWHINKLICHTGIARFRIHAEMTVFQAVCLSVVSS